MAKIKSVVPKAGNFIKSCNGCNFYRAANDDFQKSKPIFSFKYLQKDHGLECCTNEDKISLLNKITTLSQLSWQDIMQSGRHQLGCEKIGRDSFNVPIPHYITEDINLIAFRYNGKKPMVGFRDKDIFHIVWIDNNFDVYRHSA